MTYEEAFSKRKQHAGIVNTIGNDKFPFLINRLLIMPSKRDHKNEAEIIKLVIFNGHEFKKAFWVIGIKDKDFDVFVYTKEKEIEPMFLSEYLS